MKHSRPPTPMLSGQRGSVLFVALLILIGATAISLSAVNTSVMELRMAGNAEAATDTFQTALAAIDFTISDSTNLPTSGPLHQPKAVTLNGSMFQTSAGDTISASASRVDDCAAPPRARSASSLTAFSAFAYEIDATIERNASGQGRGAMTQGYILLGPKC